MLSFLITICFMCIVQASFNSLFYSYAQQEEQEEITELIQDQKSKASESFIGFNMRGYYTNMPQERDIIRSMPPNYYENSFRVFSEANLDFVRYLFIWESYERDPVAFMNELDTMVRAADKWGIKVLYTNDQFRTSSWLDPEKGYGFPSSLFQHDAQKYVRGGGGGQSDEPAQGWWTDWYNRAVANSDGIDGWALQAGFLTKIVSKVDNHKSTLGYELLNEPRLFSVDQWEKVGKYNSYLTDVLRKETQKLIFYDRQSSPSLDGPVGITPENMAKMTPANKENVIFKATLFGSPELGTIFEKRMNYYLNAAKIAGVPVCFCEFNIKQYKDEPIDDLNQENVNYFFERFQKLNLWGWAMWIWDYKPRENLNFVFVDFNNDGSMLTNDNFEFIKSANKELNENITSINASGSTRINQ